MDKETQNQRQKENKMEKATEKETFQIYADKHGYCD